MSKRKHNHAQPHPLQRPQRTQSSMGRRALIRHGLMAVGAVGVLGSGYLWVAGGKGPGRSFQVTGGERAPVLNPLRFGAPRVREAYAAAARHPDVLDKVYCYCYCDRPPTLHKSLLSCFTDFHGAG